MTTTSTIKNKLNQFRDNKRGIVYTVVVVGTVLFVATLMWIFGVLIAGNQIIDAFTAYSNVPQVAEYGATMKIMGTATIAIIDIGFIVVLIKRSLDKNASDSDLPLLD